MQTLRSLVFVSLLFSNIASAMILPLNRLDLEDDLRRPSRIGYNDFRGIIRQVVSTYLPEIRRHGAELEVAVRWEDPEVNAYAEKVDSQHWRLYFSGGMARRREMTPDGYSLIVCHEVGHLLGGYPFRAMMEAASEGQADYFATQACLRKIWDRQPEVNARFRATVSPELKTRCDRVWGSQHARDLCYRVSQASVDVARLFAVLNEDRRAPKPGTPDRKVVQSTWDLHSDTQCRLDTYLAGAVCKTEFRDNMIPGLEVNRIMWQTTGNMTPFFVQQQADAFHSSCTEEDRLGYRPRCWFKQY